MRQFIVIVSLILRAFSCDAQQSVEKLVKFSELTQADKTRLNQQKQIVFSAAKKKFGTERLSGDKADLKLIQQILDAKLFNAAQTYELQSLGVVFGDVLAKELGLRWTNITDDYGTDPTLRFGNTSLNFNALTMISKRVERGEEVKVTALFEQTKKQLTELKDRVEK